MSYYISQLDKHDDIIAFVFGVIIIIVGLGLIKMMDDYEQ